MAGGSNPYSMVLTALARALADFDDDEKIAAYGFGGLAFTTVLVRNYSQTRMWKFAMLHGTHVLDHSCLHDVQTV